MYVDVCSTAHAFRPGLVNEEVLPGTWQYVNATYLHLPVGFLCSSDRLQMYGELPCSVSHVPL